MTTFPKDPSAELDYGWEWTPWLADEETILSHTVTITGSDDALVEESSTEDDGTVIVWLSAGTHGVKYRVSCLVTTSAGRTDERTFTVSVRNR